MNFRELGNKEFNIGNYQGARGWYYKALRADGKDVYPCTNSAMTYMRLNEGEMAEKAAGSARLRVMMLENRKILAKSLSAFTFRPKSIIWSQVIFLFMNP